MKALKLHESDNVAVVLNGAAAGDDVNIYYENNPIDTVKVVGPIPKFHKIAITTLQKNDETKKYGEVIGVAVCDIEKGEHVHVHNIVSVRGSVKKI